MSAKPSRTSPSPSSPTGSSHGPKLPKFLSKANRDRSKSMVDPTGSPTPSSSSSSPAIPETPKHKKPGRRGSIFRDSTSRRQSQDVDPADVSKDFEDSPDEPPVIVEPSTVPRPRTRSERPLSDNYPSVQYYSPGSNTRITDLPTRLSGWFAHTFSSSSTDLSLPTLLSQQHLSASVSPKGKGSALLTAARHGKGHLDKAMRYLLDSDATPDKCSEPIWLLGVQHPGYEPSPPTAFDPGSSPGRRNSSDSRRGSSFRSSSSSPASPTSAPPDPSLSQSQPASANPKDPSKNWPPVFYSDFTSRIWLTYRSQFFPIRDTTLAALEAEVIESPNGLPSSPPQKRWNWPLGGEKGWTSDAGWGCMLRTGQSLLANALLHLHLGRGAQLILSSFSICSDIFQTGGDRPTLFILPITRPTSKSSPGSSIPLLPCAPSAFTGWRWWARTLARTSDNGSALVRLLALSSMFPFSARSIPAHCDRLTRSH